MFSIYAISGQVFSGTLKEMNRLNALASAKAVCAIAQDGDELGIEATVGAAIREREPEPERESQSAKARARPLVR